MIEMREPVIPGGGFVWQVLAIGFASHPIDGAVLAEVMLPPYGDTEDWCPGSEALGYRVLEGRTDLPNKSYYGTREEALAAFRALCAEYGY